MPSAPNNHLMLPLHSRSSKRLPQEKYVKGIKSTIKSKIAKISKINSNIFKIIYRIDMPSPPRLFGN